MKSFETLVLIIVVLNILAGIMKKKKPRKAVPAPRKEETPGVDETAAFEAEDEEMAPAKRIEVLKDLGVEFEMDEAPLRPVVPEMLPAEEEVIPAERIDKEKDRGLPVLNNKRGTFRKKMIQGQDDFKKAVVLAEILGPPKALQE